jgi:hypothetical protein
MNYWNIIGGLFPTFRWMMVILPASVEVPMFFESKGKLISMISYFIDLES